MKSAIVATIVLTTLALVLQSQRLTDSAIAMEPTSQPAVEATGENSREAEISADDIIKNLLMDRPKATVTPRGDVAEPTSQPTKSVAPAAVIHSIPTPPGSVIVDRVGRLNKDSDSDWWVFTFESESQILREPPLRILPSRLLETMEQISQGGRRAGIKFRVSGEIVEYRQTNYLLLRKVLVERDMGAL